LDDDVFVFDAGFLELGDGAVDEGGDDAGVPAGVDDADAEGGAYEESKVSVVVVVGGCLEG
jgi:hypothetical protein